MHRVCWSLVPRDMGAAVLLILLCAPVPLRAATPFPGAVAHGQIAASGAEVHGRVLDASGGGVAGAQIQVVHLSGERSDDRVLVTDADGAFAFHQLNPGLYEMAVRRIGFTPAFLQFRVANGSDLPLNIRLRSSVQQLDTIIANVDGMPDRYGRSVRMADFYERRQTGMGHFFTRDDIDASAAGGPADLVRRIGGMSAWNTPGGIVVNSSGCAGTLVPQEDDGTPPDGWGHIALYVDGSLIQPGYRAAEFALLTATQVEAMAVYRSPAELPPEAVGNACAAVYVWTRISG
jgi:hypothetical protein